MAINASFVIVEEGNGSPHGEVFRCVYNHTIDACLTVVDIPMSGVCYWDFARLVADQYPFGTALPPGAPRAATAATEAYVAVAAGLGGFPVGAHQDNQGVVEYAAVGVHQYETQVSAALTKIGLPAGIVVVDNLTAMTHGYPSAFETYVDNLYMVKTRGIVQALADALCTNVAVGDYLEGVAGSWDLIQDVANLNEGTFIALEAVAIDNTRIWVDIVNVNY